MWKNEDSALWFDDGTVVNVRVENEIWHDDASQNARDDAMAREISKNVHYSIEVGRNPDLVT